MTPRAGAARVLCRDWVAIARGHGRGPGLTVHLLLPCFLTCGTASERKPGAPGAPRPDPPSPRTFFSIPLSGLFEGCANLLHTFSF